MAKNEKAQKTIDNDKRKIILEKRLARLEKLMGEKSSGDDPATILLDALTDGYISAEALCRELINQVSPDQLWLVCDTLGLVEESEKVSDKPVKNEDDGGKYNEYDICREILDEFDDTNWIGARDIDRYLDKYYPEMSDDDRWLVHDRMEKFTNVDQRRSVADFDDDDDFESCKRTHRHNRKNESTRLLNKRSLTSRYKK